MSDSNFYEEYYESKDRKKYRKLRKLAQEGDRSKYKKTDQAKKNPSPSIKKDSYQGQITSISGEEISVHYEGKKISCVLKGSLKKEKTQQKNLLAVGDFIYFSFVGENRGVISSIAPRYSYLSRVDVTGKKEQLIAVNIDQVLITLSVVTPPLKPSLVDRYIIAAKRGKMEPILLINKIDLLEKKENLQEKKFYEEFLSAYEPTHVPILSVSATKKEGVEALLGLMKNKTSVFSGQSGVGKSSLINACLDLDLKTGGMTQKTYKGSHTTTTARLVPVKKGGHCIDTPGIRSFGIWELTKQEVLDHFTEFKHLDTPCRYPNCSHLKEPNCSVQKALEDSLISPLRFASYQSLIESIDNPSRR